MKRFISRRACVIAGVMMVLSVLTGCVGKGGTTIMLRTNELAPPSQKTHGKIALLDEADDAYPHSPTIGEATWTLFRNHLAVIKAEPPPKKETIVLAKDALAKAGYEVRLVQASQATSSQDPLVHLKIDEFAYELYNWTWPYVLIWGDTAITMSIRTSNEQQKDIRTFRASGRESCWFGECQKQVEAAVAHSLTLIMNQVVAWASEESFQKIVTASQPRASVGP